MKNIIVLTIALFTCTRGLYAAQNHSGDTQNEIAIRVVVIGSDIPCPRPRSVQPVISAALEENELWIDFYEPVGAVAIAVRDAYGRVVCAHSCDTAYEPTVILYVPTEMGCYTVNIMGNRIEAYGEYTYE